MWYSFWWKIRHIIFELTTHTENSRSTKCSLGIAKLFYQYFNNLRKAHSFYWYVYWCVYSNIPSCQDVSKVWNHIFGWQTSRSLLCVCVTWHIAYHIVSEKYSESQWFLNMGAVRETIRHIFPFYHYLYLHLHHHQHHSPLPLSHHPAFRYIRFCCLIYSGPPRSCAAPTAFTFFIYWINNWISKDMNSKGIEFWLCSDLHNNNDWCLQIWL